MKNNKMLVVGLMGLVFGLFSQIKALEFELLNKSGKTITVTVESSEIRVDKIEMGKKTVLEGEPYQFNNKVFPGSISITLKTLGVKESHSYDITLRSKTGYKTCYVTYGEKDGVLKLYPQTGPCYGYLGKTKSGCSLSNNVTANDIENDDWD